jgi:hypothetical protein
VKFKFRRKLTVRPGRVENVTWHVKPSRRYRLVPDPDGMSAWLEYNDLKHLPEITVSADGERKSP